MKYDLEERSYKFAADVRKFIRKLGNSISVVEDGKQVIRSSGSVAANYIEANDALSKKDFLYRIKVCRKESKESVLFLRLLDVSGNTQYEIEKSGLINEATELMKIFGTILHKSQ